MASFAEGLLTGFADSRRAKKAREMRERELSVMEGLREARAAQAPEQMPYVPPDGTAPSATGAFPSSLIHAESGGKWTALNRQGYGGRLQFGDARLADAAAAGLVPAGTTGAAFSRMSPEEQQRVENWHFADIDRQARRRGLDRYIGQNVGGVQVTPDGIRAMAHLGGIDGAARFLTSGGRYNPADANGTTLAAYGRAHGGRGTAVPPPASTAPQAGTPTAPEAAAEPAAPRKPWAWFFDRLGGV